MELEKEVAAQNTKLATLQQEVGDVHAELSTVRGDLAQFETAEQEARLWRAAVVFSISQQAREFVFAPANDRDRERRRLRKAYGTVEDIRAATLTEPQQARRVQVEALVQAAEKRLEVVADFDTLASTWASLRAEDDQGAPGAAH